MAVRSSRWSASGRGSVMVMMFSFGIRSGGCRISNLSRQATAAASVGVLNSRRATAVS